MIFFTKTNIFQKLFERPAFKISFGYLLVGLAYIYFSDKALLLIVRDPVLLTKIQTFKGFGFIVVSSSALFIYLMSSYVIKKNAILLKRIEDNKDEYNAKLKQSYNELQVLHAELEKRVEERTSELTIVNKDLRTFSSSLSHDLRTPLRAIVNFAQTLKKDNIEKPVTLNLEYIDNILLSCIQMNKLIDDILKYTKIGREGIVLAEVELDKIFEEVLKILNSRIEDTSAIIKISKNMPIIESEAGLLKQIFTNLIDNAIIYQKKDSKPKITIDFEIEKDDYINIFFKDNGIGIAPENFEMIFNIFL